MSEIAIAAFNKGDFSNFDRQLQRLETLKIGTIRSLINQEVQLLEQKEGEHFNKDFAD